MSFTLANAKPATPADKEALEKMVGIFNVHLPFDPVTGKPGEYVGWIQIHPDGQVEFGHPG